MHMSSSTDQIQSEGLHSHPIASIPKSVMKAPPLDTANPTPAHNYLPVPASSAKLKSHGVSAASPEYEQRGSAVVSQVIKRFPPDSSNLSEQELDPYFISFEASTKDLEHLLTGPMEKVNR